MQTWLYTFAAKLAASGLLTALTSRQAMAVGGFTLILIGSIFGSVPIVLIGAFSLIWISRTEPAK